MNYNIEVIGIVGAGKVGAALAKALAQRGEQVLVLTRYPVEDLRCLSRSQLKQFLEKCDKIVICLRESEIASWAKTASRAGVDLSNKVFVHTAGTLDASVLQALKDAGARCGVAHPAASFAGPDPLIFSNASFGVSGDPGAIEFGQELAQTLGCESFQVRDHTLYHAACVFAAGFVASMLQLSLRVMSRASSAGEKQVLGLAMSVLKNAEKNGIENALTGPQVRGERKVVDRHTRALMACDPAGARLYNVVSDYIMRKHENQGQRPDMARLEEVLACPKCKGPVEHQADKQRFVCWNCRLVFKVKDGIPMMMLDHAEEI